MNTLRKWRWLALAILALVVGLQIGVSLLVRARTMHAYLTGRLERAFGRPVEVGSFGARIFPSPRLDAEAVTVGEDPGFGNEYFLRAESLSAGLRWIGLLRGHFEFGTLSLTRPSLILVRNAESRWNMERWLPPAKLNPGARVYGPPSPVDPVNRLEKIEFDDGRINFKNGQDKQPFAFTGVSGSVQQISPGRWQVRLEAQPWRSGVALQSAGTVLVQGDVAGTSLRLQPAEISLQWSQASLADVFRLFRGQDYGVRGTFSLQASAKSANAKGDQPGDWIFAVQGHVARIHRWDLTERSDNPSLNLSAKGRWNIGAQRLAAEQIAMEGPSSNLRGVFNLAGGSASSMEFRIDSMGIQASDLLAWYRAFHPGVAEGVTAQQYFTGGMILRGWPLAVQSAALSSGGGVVRVPGFRQAIRIGPVAGGLERSNLVIGPIRAALGGEIRNVMMPKRRRIASAMENAADLTFTQNLNTQSGNVSIEGNISRVEDFLKLSAAIWRPLNYGWELNGPATATTRWDWKKPFSGQWNGQVAFSDASLTVAGLNQPLEIAEGAMDWVDGRRVVHNMKVKGFGGTWTGTIEERQAADSVAGAKWNFHLSADHLDAAELDRWVGPRARPGWLQRLLSSLLGSSAPSSPASELVRRVSAAGDVEIQQLTIEKLKFARVHAKGSLRDLRLHITDAGAQWAGGTVSATLAAKFLPRPSYDITANVDRVNLAELPPAEGFANRLGGVASGRLQLRTEGVGRDELLSKLAGRCDFRLNKVEFRGWDVDASVADGAARAGVSRWTTGEGSFRLQDRIILLDDLRLQGTKEATLLAGTLDFGQQADFTIETAVSPKNRNPKTINAEPGHVLKISGPLARPQVSVEKPTVRQPAD